MRANMDHEPRYRWQDHRAAWPDIVAYFTVAALAAAALAAIVTLTAPDRSSARHQSGHAIAMTVDH